ncbi:hypothetical protein J6590_068410 [Homalodisca vitripennis]|nr:hypothetical protein J6590_068410 [Homalodisca vitripennis]
MGMLEYAASVSACKPHTTRGMPLSAARRTTCPTYQGVPRLCRGTRQCWVGETPQLWAHRQTHTTLYHYL